MAFTDLGSLGATGSTANNQASLALTTSAAASVGELVVLVIADDNRLSGADGDGSEVSSISDTGSGGTNNWTKALGFANNNAATQAGAACLIYYSVITNAIANGGTITINFTNSTLSDATAVTARHFSFSPGSTISVGATNTLANDAADPGSLDATTSNREALRVRGIAAEVGNNTNLTNTANWTAWANGNSATTGTTAEMCARAEHRISTGTGDASDPTYVAADCASCYVAFYEDLGLAPNLFTDTDTFYSATVSTTYSLTPSLFTDTDTFFSATVSLVQTLTPNLFTNTQSFPSATVATSYTLTPNLFTDVDTFYSATVSPGVVTLTPSLFSNTNTFFNSTVNTTYTLIPNLFTNSNVFYSASVDSGGIQEVKTEYISLYRRRRK